MQDAINKFKNRLFIFSFGLGLASTIWVFQPNESLKNIGKSLFSFSIAGIVLGEVFITKVTSEINKKDEVTEEKIERINYEVVAVTRNLDKAINELTATKNESERLKTELQQALEYLKIRNNEVVIANNKIHDLENKLRDVGRFSTSEAHKIVRETYDRSVLKLEAHIQALMRNYAPIADEFNNVLIETDKLRNRYLKKLEEYEALTSFNDLIDIGLDMQDKIINQCIELRVKGQTIAIKYLNALLENTIDYDEASEVVNNLKNHAGQTIQQLKNQNEAEVRAIVSDWVVANNQHIENYEVNYTQLIEDGKQAIAALQKRDTMIADMQSELNHLRQPWKFTGTIDYADAGNAIINFYYSAYGYVLDAMGWQEIETGYTLTFATARNKTYLTADMLHDKDNREQLAGLTNALSLPTFTPNYQSGLMILEVNTRKPAKKQSNERDISKLWKPVEKFEETVKGWSRVRLTGGSESGKSPTAENIACVILKHRPGTAKLYNPQHNSQKNYWTIPVVGTSHKDSEKAIAALAKQIDARSNAQESRDVFELSIFDEVDSSMSHTKGKKSIIGNDVNFIIKQASHQNLGAIFIGQNANVSEYPGMDRSDWNNAINVHIGANCYDAITNSNQFTNEEITRLKSIADKLTEYCSGKNEQLGLDRTDQNAYRFAFVVEPSQKPYFIELPNFGCYTYNQLTTVEKLVNNLATQPQTSYTLETYEQHESPEALKNGSVSVAAIQPQTGNVAVCCLSCNSSNLKKAGKYRGVQRYQCKDCGKSFS